MEVRIARQLSVCRYGGEEFAAVMPDLSSAQATALIEKLMLDFTRLSVPADASTLDGHTCSGSSRPPVILPASIASGQNKRWTSVRMTAYAYSCAT